MLAKTLRSFERSLGDDISERELTCEDFTSLINVARVYIMKNCDTLRVSSFCTMIDEMCTALRNGHFDASPSTGKRKREVIPKIAPHHDVRWIDNGLCNSFRDVAFISMFMQSLSEYVQKHAVQVITPLGTTQITTDDSITDALNNLPRGYIEILRCVQDHIWKNSAIPLFIYSTEAGLGGPGSPARLAIDLIESQLYSAKAIAEKRYNDLFDASDGATPIGEALGRDIIEMLGPYAVNVAYGPLLQHAMFKQIEENNYALFDAFVDACCDKETGIKGDVVRVMGLHTFIGSFMLSTKLPEPRERFENLLCRSQIPNEVIGNMLSPCNIRRLFACFCDADNYDMWIMLTFSAGCHLLRKYEFEVLSRSFYEKLVHTLRSQALEMKDILDEDCYEELLDVCSSIITESVDNSTT